MSKGCTRLNILFLCRLPEEAVDASTIIDHIRAFENYSNHKIFVFSDYSASIPESMDLERFDVVIIHYSISLFSRRYLSDSARNRIKLFGGVKVAFVQDEYRRVNATRQALNEMLIDILYTCVPEQELEKVYPESELPNVIKVNNLTGYVPEKLITAEVPELSARPIDVGYRARKLPFWLGELAAEKWQIVDKFNAVSLPDNLRVDLSYKETDRIYGKSWIDFVRSCKAMLGVESGASVFDFTGKLEYRVDLYQLFFNNASFEKTQEKFLLPYENKIKLNQISPRCFECIALRTAMILYEGSYSGILEPWRHYLPLRKDFGNIEQILDMLQDDENLQAMIDRAYVEIGLNKKYSYSEFVLSFDGIISKAFEAKQILPVPNPYLEDEYLQAFKKSRNTTSAVIGSFRKHMSSLWKRMPDRFRRFLRILLLPLTDR